MRHSSVSYSFWIFSLLENLWNSSQQLTLWARACSSLAFFIRSCFSLISFSSLLRSYLRLCSMILLAWKLQRVHLHWDRVNRSGLCCLTATFYILNYLHYCSHQKNETVAKRFLIFLFTSLLPLAGPPSALHWHPHHSPVYRLWPGPWLPPPSVPAACSRTNINLLTIFGFHFQLPSSEL